MRTLRTMAAVIAIGVAAIVPAAMTKIGKCGSRKAAARPGGRRAIRRLRGHRLAVVLAVVGNAAALTLAVSVPAGETAPRRTLACSSPSALVPPVFSDSPNPGDWISYGHGEYFCDPGSAYTVRLLNNSGNILAQNSGSAGSGYIYVGTASVGCAGAIVKSWLYRNHAGSGASDTSGTNSDCSY